MLGDEGRVCSRRANEEVTSAVVYERTFAEADELDHLTNDGGVNHGFSAQEAGFTGVLIVFEVAEDEEGCGGGDETSDQYVGGIDGGVVEAGVMRNDVASCGGVGREGRCGGASERNEPLQIARAKVDRRGQDVSSVRQEVCGQQEQGGLGVRLVFERNVPAGGCSLCCGAHSECGVVRQG